MLWVQLNTPYMVIVNAHMGYVFMILFIFKFYKLFFFVLSFVYGSSLPSHEEIAEVESIGKKI